MLEKVDMTLEEAAMKLDVVGVTRDNVSQMN